MAVHLTDLTVQPGAMGSRVRRALQDEPGRADRNFNRVTLASGISILVLLTLVGFFLLYQSRHAFARVGWTFFRLTEWRTNVYPPVVGVVGLLFGTVVVAAVAVLIAVPFGVLVGLYITEYSPIMLRKLLQSMVDLLAAIPSIIFGLWGYFYLKGEIVPLSVWLSAHVGWFPLFHGTTNASYSESFFIAGIVVSFMVIPIVASISRAVFAQTPPGEKEAALALGSTHWGMIRSVVFPFGRGGIIGGSMLGLGRALGETIAVSLLLPQVPWVSDHILQTGGATIAGFIALRAGSDPFTVSALMAAGLVLFILTLGTNLVASTIVSRSRSGAGVDL